MSELEAADPACVVRASAGADGGVRLHSGHHSFSAEGRTGLAAKAAHPSPLDYLLAALAADLVAGLMREARRTGSAFDAIELSLTGRLANPLVALGVVGEEGSARLARIRGSLYLSSEGPEARLLEMWDEVRRKAPVYATLAASSVVDITLKFEP
jgi:hypothetical protein